ncbi:serine O-acetyltransferase [Limobrevibacterium gyesilva]|uniref:Serine acetyltransferase n=1 Tax=Limobrevibacterium gyesilva TaxID=2991712 RepID=A0AA42CEU0_9PROT|nr:serine O-acetyltransferase [Limobrevibacterium gyesilva]MCW3476463.1 serine O-acetyltransferase [Limobrevibacterium gyesilva]
MADLACSMRSLSIQAGVDLWATIHRDADAAVARDRLMSSAVRALVLRHSSFPDALACNLARKLADDAIDAPGLAGVITDALEDDPDIIDATVTDLRAIRERDPACPDLLTPFLYFKGFHALQAHRISHWLWRHGRQHLARHMQSRISEVFAADIHPAARLGRGIMIDHGTGLVIGETAVVEDDVSMLQEVTLGGTGKETGDRHPKIRRGVLIGAGAKILGNIEVGEGAKVGAGSIVLDAVAPYTTVVGVPARPVGPRNTCLPALTMDQTLPHDWVI